MNKPNSDKFRAESVHLSFSSLKYEFLRGKDHLSIYQSLNESIKKFPDVADDYSNFFRLTEMAHLEVSFMILARIFDASRGRPVSLKYFLTAAKENLSEFVEENERKIKKVINTDLHNFSVRNNSQIKELTELRHNALAHYDNVRIHEDPRKRIESFFKYETRNLGLIFSLYEELETLIIKYGNLLYNEKFNLITMPRFIHELVEKLDSTIQKEK